MKKIICTLLLICTLVGCLSACVDPASNEFQLVSGEKEMFELYVPKTWVSNLSSGVASAYASFEDKVLVSARSSDDFVGYTLDEFLNISVQSFESMSGYELVSEAKATTLGGKAAYVLEYKAMVTETVNFVPVPVSYKFKVVLAQNEHYFVTLTYCAPEKNYDKAVGDFDRIISKFVFKEVEASPDGLLIASGNDEIFKLYIPTTWVPDVSGGAAGAHSSTSTKNIVSARTLRQAKNYTLEEFTTITVKSFRKMDDYQVVTEPAETTLGGQKAYVTEYKATIAETVGNKAVNVTYKFKTFVAKLEATFTILTYCAPETDYETTLGDFNTIVEKFEFKSFKDGEIEKDDFMDTTTNAPEGYQIASSDKYEFRFYVPITWTVQRRTYNPKAYYSATDLSNVTINTVKADEYVYDGKTYWEDYTATTSFEITDVVIDENAKMGGRDAYAVEFTQNISGISYKMKQVFLPANSVIYVFTYTSTVANYNRHLEDINKMIEMFELK